MQGRKYFPSAVDDVGQLQEFPRFLHVNFTSHPGGNSLCDLTSCITEPFCSKCLDRHYEDRLIGSYLLLFRLNSSNYLICLEYGLSQFLKLSVLMRPSLQFLHDGHPIHFSHRVRNHLTSPLDTSVSAVVVQCIGLINCRSVIL
ncbi:hypothetical protein AVEN_163996-1 [Araneus ventricosus]|uniref:Uncharacterized protein n=1 Tax=Araneus ventricosus TaxID=182803 RepID=A0A4Y2D9M7_ARAVE|nr:hypothetical protein AVEN_163996-1 [Araneus ventricosus]